MLCQRTCSRGVSIMDSHLILSKVDYLRINGKLCSSQVNHKIPTVLVCRDVAAIGESKTNTSAICLSERPVIPSDL